MTWLQGGRRSGRAVIVSLLVAGAVPLVASAAPTPSSWPSGGHDISNTHSNPAETKLNANNVQGLAVKWTFTTHGDVSANPAVVNGAVFFPDWGGYLNKANASTGALIWSRPISDYDGIAGAISRSSPAVSGNTVYVGDQNGGHLMAVDATTGNSLWTTQVDAHPAAILTAGPVVYNGVVYQGVASLE